LVGGAERYFLAAALKPALNDWNIAIHECPLKKG